MVDAGLDPGALLLGCDVQDPFSGSKEKVVTMTLPAGTVGEPVDAEGSEISVLLRASGFSP